MVVITGLKIRIGIKKVFFKIFKHIDLNHEDFVA